MDAKLAFVLSTFGLGGFCGFEAGHCFHSLFSSSFSTSSFTHFGDTPEAEILFPPHFGITRQNIKQINQFVLFILFYQKKMICGRFFCFLQPASVVEPGPTPLS